MPEDLADLVQTQTGRNVGPAVLADILCPQLAGDGVGREDDVFQVVPWNVGVLHDTDPHDIERQHLPRRFGDARKDVLQLQALGHGPRDRGEGDAQALVMRGRWAEESGLHGFHNALF